MLHTATCALLLLLLVVNPLPLQAEVYRVVGPDGSVIFTDQPTPEGEPVTPGPTTLYPSPARPSPAPANTTTPVVVFKYNGITITSPQPNETLRENSGSVTVSVAVDPQLNAPAGDRVQIQLDGQIIKKEPQQLNITLEQLDRGAHTLSAAVVNKAGNPLIQAQPVTFFLHRTIRR